MLVANETRLLRLYRRSRFGIVVVPGMRWLCGAGPRPATSGTFGRLQIGGERPGLAGIGHVVVFQEHEELELDAALGQSARAVMACAAAIREQLLRGFSLIEILRACPGTDQHRHCATGDESPQPPVHSHRRHVPSKIRAFKKYVPSENPPSRIARRQRTGIGGRTTRSPSSVTTCICGWACIDVAATGGGGNGGAGCGDRVRAAEACADE